MQKILTRLHIINIRLCSGERAMLHKTIIIYNMQVTLLSQRVAFSGLKGGQYLVTHLAFSIVDISHGAPVRPWGIALIYSTTMT